MISREDTECDHRVQSLGFGCEEIIRDLDECSLGEMYDVVRGQGKHWRHRRR